MIQIRSEQLAVLSADARARATADCIAELRRQFPADASTLSDDALRALVDQTARRCEVAGTGNPNLLLRSVVAEIRVLRRDAGALPPRIKALS